MTKRRRKPAPAGTPVPLDAKRWSQASRRSLAVEFADAHYHDVTARCIRCANDFVFSAEEQRQAFEVFKAYIAQCRRLCGECWRARLRLAAELADIRARWGRDRAAVKPDVSILVRWKQALAQLPCHGLGEDRAQRAMVDRLLAAAHRSG